MAQIMDFGIRCTDLDSKLLEMVMLGMTAYTPLLLVSMVSRTSSTVIVRAFDSEGSAGVALAVLSALL